MTSPPVELVGCQEPRVLFRPDYVTERRGVEAIQLAAEVGLDLDPWQQLAVRVLLAEREGGLFAAAEGAVLVSRQNGKGAILEAIMLEGLFLARDPLTLVTSHEFKTSQESFIRMRGLVEGSDWLRRQVKRITASHGEERVELRGGQRLRWIARSKSSGRGFSPQRILFDEAQEMSTAAIDALLPSMRAQPNRQSIYCGTVPSQETNHPEHWTRLRNRGRAGRGDRLAWMEWTPEGSDDPDTAERIRHNDVEVIRAANPGLGYRINLDTVLDDAESMDPASFGRETLSIWPTLPDEEETDAIDMERWAGLRKERSKLAKEAPVCLGVDVAWGRKSGSIAVAGPSRKGDRALVMTYTEPGIDWIVGKVAQLVEKYEVLEVGVDPGSASGVLLPDMQAAEIEVVLMQTRTLGSATALMMRAVEESTVEHLGQGELDDAVKSARVRQVADYELWDRKESPVDIAPLVAASIALHGFTKHQNEDYDPLDSIA